MDNRLPSITDENHILITAEFIPFGKQIDSGNKQYFSYSIDLIVNKKIRYQKLLDAIHVGLKEKVKDDPDNQDVIKTDHFGLVDAKVSITEFDQRASSERMFEEAPYIVQLRERLEKELYLEDVHSEERKNIEKNLRKDIYKVCLYTFEQCMEETTDHTDGHINGSNQENQRHPLEREETFVGIGSFVTKNVSDEKEIKSYYQYQMHLRQNEHGQMTLEELGFVTSTCLIFDITGWFSSRPNTRKTAESIAFDDLSKYNIGNLFKEEEGCKAFRELPKYNVSDNPIYQLDNEPIQIIPPTDPPAKPKADWVMMIAAPVFSVLALIVVRSLVNTGYGNGMIYLSLATTAVSVIMMIWSLTNQKKNYREELGTWKSHYEGYIDRVIKDIKNKQEWNIAELKKIYPPKALDTERSPEQICLEMKREYAEHNNFKSLLTTLKNQLTRVQNKNVRKNSRNVEKNLVDMTFNVNGEIFSRQENHPDFMSVRLGLSGVGSQLVPSSFEIKGEKKDVVFHAVKYKNIDGIPDAAFSIILPEKDEIPQGGDGFLTELPASISEKYTYLEAAPVLVNLRECGTLGVVFPENKRFQPFLDNLLLDLCFYQSPEELQCIIFFEEEHNWRNRQIILDKYKHLPHFKELLGDISAFAFCEEDADLILNRLLELLNKRKGEDKTAKYPHILMIVLNEYNFKRHPVSDYLMNYSNANEYRQSMISFVFCERYLEKLPKYCGKIITVSETNDQKWYLYPHIRKKNWMKGKKHAEDDKYCFIPDIQSTGVDVTKYTKNAGNPDDRELNDNYYRAYKILSALYFERIAQGAGIPGGVELLDLVEFVKKDSDGLQNLLSNLIQQIAEMKEDDKDAEEQILQQRREYQIKLREIIKTIIYKEWNIEGKGQVRDVTKSLAVPIGKKAEDVFVELDLHEKADGPHMLVAGTTGSGKTETILTILIQLCLLYTPKQVNLLLIDMKGGGFVKRIGTLPHVVGTVTDIDGDESGAGASYMLKRFLKSMSAEVKRRKRLFNQMGVDSIDGYIAAKANVKKHVEEVLKMDLDSEDLREKEKAREKVKQLEALDDLAHLFMVVDEFTELMRFSKENSDVDFKEEITSLARVGRSLGFHIILVSQNIENAITDDIRVNSRARLCLKVATREASKEMIGSDLAAHPLMPGNGRAYLLVGTGSRFEYFQSGYSGADAARNMEAPIRITQAEMSGRYSMFYDSSSDEQIKTKTDLQKQGITQLSIMVDAINDVFHEQQGKNSRIQKPFQIFQSALPRKCFYDYDMEWPDKARMVSLD